MLQVPLFRNIIQSKSDHWRTDYLHKSSQPQAWSSHCACQTSTHPPEARSTANVGRTPIIPKDVLRETIWTIEMLFPIKDNYDKKPFLGSRYPPEEARKHIYGDKIDHMDESPPDDLYRYHFWRERLLELYEEYNAPPPNFFKRRDRKNPLAFYGFYLSLC